MIFCLFVCFLLEFTTSGQESSDVDIYWILIFRLEIRSLSQNIWAQWVAQT